MANLLKNRASLSDIAREVGVSKTTVSVVLNDKGSHISEETRRQILKVARELNYRPNRLARGLSMGRSNMIGLIVSDLANVFYSIIAKSVEKEANALGYEVLICSSNEDPQKEVKLLQMFRERQIDGVIISSTQKVEAEIRQLQKEDYPFVLIDRAYPDINAHSVLIDNFQGAFDAVSYLAGMGYSRIGLITTLNHLDSMRERFDGYKEALRRNSLPFESSLFREVGFRDMDKQIERALIDLLKPPSRIDALFITNNKLAVSALKALQRMDIRIPRDLAVLSFDDVEAFSITDPPLTAVKHPAEEIGKRAVQILIEDIHEEDREEIPKKKVILPVELIVRNSCGG